MVEIVKSGGWLMLPIILCAILAMGIILERFWTLRQKRVIPEDLVQQSDLPSEIVVGKYPDWSS